MPVPDESEMKNSLRLLHLLSCNAPEYYVLLEQVYAILDQARTQLTLLRGLMIHCKMLLLMFLLILGKSGLSVLKNKPQSLVHLKIHLETLNP